MEHTYLENSTCVTCKADLNAATHGVQGYTPRPGDFSFCFYCAEFMVFDEELKLRKVSEEEINSLSEEETEYYKYIRKNLLRFIAESRDEMLN
jgi:hypothetical protein